MMADFVQVITPLKSKPRSSVYQELPAVVMLFASSITTKQGDSGEPVFALNRYNCTFSRSWVSVSMVSPSVNFSPIAYELRYICKKSVPVYDVYRYQNNQFMHKIFLPYGYLPVIQECVVWLFKKLSLFHSPADVARYEFPVSPWTVQRGYSWLSLRL